MAKKKRESSQKQSPSPTVSNLTLDGKDKRIVDIQMEIMRRQATAYEHIEKGNTAFDAGNLQEALASYNSALNLAPNHVEALGNRANVKSALNDWDGCIADTSRIISNFKHKRELNGSFRADDDGDVFNLSVTYYTQAEAYYNLQRQVVLNK